MNILNFDSNKAEDVLKFWSEYYYLPVYQTEDGYVLFGEQLEFIQNYSGYYNQSSHKSGTLTVYYHKTEVDYQFYCYSGENPIDILAYADKFDEIRAMTLV